MGSQDLPPSDPQNEDLPARGRREGDQRPVPALRQVPAEPVQVKAESAGSEDDMVVVLQDPEGYAQQPAVLSPAAYALAQLFDGDRTAEEVAEAFEAMYEQSIQVDEIHRLERELDRALFLSR